jgi:hypothetical protein
LISLPGASLARRMVNLALSIVKIRFWLPSNRRCLIGIGGHLAVPPLPHHRAYGSVPRAAAQTVCTPAVGSRPTGAGAAVRLQ